MKMNPMQAPNTGVGKKLGGLGGRGMAKIMMGDKEILTGDRQSVIVIYNNLTGKNFTNKKEYRQYLKNMGESFKVKIIPDKLRVQMDT